MAGIAVDELTTHDDGAAMPGGDPPLDLSAVQEKLASTQSIGVDPAAYFITRFCLTADDTGTTHAIPNWGFTLRYIRALEAGDNLVVEKSRQMMATWIACSFFVWKLLFVRGSAGFMASRKEALVDDGGENSTRESLLGRVRYIYDRLPDWAKAMGPVQFSHLRVTAKWNESYIRGESSNPNLGRGGTFTHGLLDEAAFMPQSETVFAAISDACKRGLILQSTPNGRANAFARLVHSKDSGFRRIRLHWTDHPERWNRREFDTDGKPTSAVYREMKAKMSPDQLAREWDINYAASVSGLVYPEFNYDRHFRSDLGYDPDLALHVGMDFGIGAPTAAVVFQIHGREVHVLADYEMPNAPAETNARNIWHVIRGLGFQGDRDEVICHGDPAGNAREIATGSSVIREYRAAGFTQFTTPRVKLRDGIRLLKNKFHRNEIYFSLDCMKVAERIGDYKYPTDDLGNVKGDEPSKTGQDAMATHIMDGLRYGITGCFPVDGEAVGILRETPTGERAQPLPVGRDIPKAARPGEDWRPIAGNVRRF